MKNIILALMILCGMAIGSANAQVIFSDDFEVYPIMNPITASNFAGTTGGNAWVPTNEAANASRTFASGLFGVTQGWISNVDGSGLISPGITVDSNYNYMFNFMAAGDSSTGPKALNIEYDVMVGTDAASAVTIIGGPLTGIAYSAGTPVPPATTADYTSKPEHMFHIPFTTGTIGAGHKVFTKIIHTGTAEGFGDVWFIIDDVSVEKMQSAQAPILVSPADEAVDVGVAPTFSWESPVAGTPSSLTLTYGTDPNADTGTTVVLAGDATEYTVPANLAFNTEFAWKVTATTGGNNYDSAVFSFTTAPELPVIDPATPPSVLVNAGETATTSVAAINPLTGDATGLNYQWFGPNGLIAEATDATVTVENVQQGNGTEGEYYCKVTVAATGANANSGTAYIQSKQIVGHWPLDTNATDIIGGNSGIIEGDPNFVTEAVMGDGAVELGGSPAQIHVPTAGLHMNSYTVSIWEYSPDNGNAGYIVASGDPDGFETFYARRKDATANYTIRTGNNGFSTIASTREQWHLITISFDGATGLAAVYIDGVLFYGTYAPSIMPAMDEFIYIGGRKTHPEADDSRYFIGKLDDLRLYNYALDKYEVAQLYVNGSGEGMCVEYPAYDLTGPEGTPDCEVNILDFALIANAWMDNNFVYPQE
ncbi:MAG: LamG domain-containing protein [Phycisphaerae bacterium]|nr:LamG domain-containing protein [Phycisphaerae bacterium]